jgi:ABC-2 type transport system permease protein
VTADLMTVIWKERKGLFRVRGSRGRFLLTLLSPILLAIWLPWEAGREWVEGIPSVLLSVAVPIILVAITIPDSFAGERERHTLGTLLASRLPDRAILFGKVIVSMAFALTLTFLMLALGLVVANVAHWEGELMFYAPLVLFADVALSILLAGLLSGAGVLISFRSASVQEATQTLTAIFLMPPMILGFVLMAFTEQLRDVLANVKAEHIVLIVLAILIAANMALHAAVLSRFKRSRLTLLD